MKTLQRHQTLSSVSGRVRRRDDASQNRNVSKDPNGKTVYILAHQDLSVW
jgi:hypothetical protein